MQTLGSGKPLSQPQLNPGLKHHPKPLSQPQLNPGQHCVDPDQPTCTHRSPFFLHDHLQLVQPGIHILLHTSRQARPGQARPGHI